MASTEQLMSGGQKYVQLQTDSPSSSRHHHRSTEIDESNRIFDELPKATILEVSRPDAADISPLLLAYTILFQYKQFKWQLVKKPPEVFFLHFALKKRKFIEEIHERQEQVIEWLQNLGIGDHANVMHDDEEPELHAVHVRSDESARNRDVPSSAALPIIRPALGRQNSIADRAKRAMQGYLNHFLSNIHIVNSQEVCRFLEVSRLSFSPEYGPKLKEDYIVVKHLPKIQSHVDDINCCSCKWFSCCRDNWQKVWAVLKPGFLALLKDPFDPKPLDIILFDVLPASDSNGDSRVLLAEEVHDHNPLRHYFRVTCGTRSLTLRTKSDARVKDWVAAINDAALRSPEGWCHPHRFGSFAPPRGLTEDGSQAQWFIDGSAAFEAIASAIEEAKSEIYICGWWLCPELYMRRPFHAHPSSRFDSLLESKAKQGVQIYILLYKEVALALKINSVYSKKRLVGIHENIKVLRYPDHFSSGVYLWSHHEKIVIVDHQICFVGGLDLCFGRYDSGDHNVGDQPPLRWPGKDYYNPRESEPNSWEDTMKDELDRQKYPRMPWHDVHCAIWGPPCRDIARHFVQRWNYAKRNKAANEQAIPLLMPQHHMVIPHYMGINKEKGCPDENVNRDYLNTNGNGSFPSPPSTGDIPLLVPQDENVNGDYLNTNGNRSFPSPPSTGDIPLLVPQDADAKDAVSGEPEFVQFNIPHANRNPFSFHKLKIKQLNPDMPMRAFTDDLQRKRSSGQDVSGKKLWETQERDDQAVSADEIGQVGPRVSCRCQVLRSVSQWSAGTSQTEDSIHNAYCSLIERAEHFIYIENQFFISGLSGDEIIRNRVLEAIYKRILRAHDEKKCFRVIIVIPLLPGFQGGVDDSGAASVRAIMHWQYRTISRGPDSILHNLYDLVGARMHEYVSFYGLRSHGRLFDGGPVASSQVYVHSKIMIIDDRAALVGSANINDRSLLGSRDSEIAVLIEDNEFVESWMGGRPWKAGKFALSLRISLWSEHLGLHAGEVNQIRDPVIDSTYKDIWMATAKTNTIIYQDVFSCIPNDLIHTRVSLRQSLSSWKEKIGHTTIDLGIAPNKLECYHEEDVTGDPMERLEYVKGHLVSFPLEFMCREDLRPVFNESEYYASPQVFH